MGKLIFDKKIKGKNLPFDRLVSPEAIAELLDVSRKFVYEHIESGDLKAQPVGRRLKRVRLSVLEKWLSRQQDGGPYGSK